MRPFHKIIIMKEFIILFMLVISSISSIEINSFKPDFGKMMNEKREQIKELRKLNIELDRRIRYSENYNITKLKTIKKYYTKE